LIAKLRLELVQQPDRVLAIQSRLVPVGHHDANEYADHNDQKLDRDRGPVLRPKLGGRALKIIATAAWPPPASARRIIARFPAHVRNG
jgi:hypothetical protein